MGFFWLKIKYKHYFLWTWFWDTWWFCGLKVVKKILFMYHPSLTSHNVVFGLRKFHCFVSIDEVVDTFQWQNMVFFISVIIDLFQERATRSFRKWQVCITFTIFCRKITVFILKHNLLTSILFSKEYPKTTKH